MLQITNLCKSFDGKTVIDHLSLNIPEGCVFGLVGTNGIGKSTLFRMIAGVYQPDDGCVLLNGKNTFFEPSIRSSIAFVSDEQYYPLGCTLSTLKALYKAMYSFSSDIYDYYKNLFQLDDHTPLSTLSKGNQKKAALLLALSIQPEVILLDEVYDALEPLTRIQVKKELHQLTRQKHTSILIASHNLMELEEFCDSFGMIKDGKLICYGNLSKTLVNVNRYQIAFSDPKSAQIFRHLDLLHIEQSGSIWNLIVRGNPDETYQKLDALKPVLLNVSKVNFEELFIYEMESRGSCNE